MECDVAVLGGGPGGYTAAIRAAQLGARAVCVEQEPELGGTCLRVGCIPTKAWVQTAHAIHQAGEVFAKFGVDVSAPQLNFGQAVEWKNGVVKQMTGGVAGLFKANGVEWVKGRGRFSGPNTISVEDGEDVTFKSAIVATGSFPLRPPIDGLDSPRCVDSTGLLAQSEVPERLVVLGGGIIGVEFASIFQRFGSGVTIIEMLPRLIPPQDEDASNELAKQFQRRGITLQLEKTCNKVEDSGSELTVHFGEGETTQADLMLVAVGRGPTVENLGLEEIGVEFDPRKGIAADERRRTTVEHIYAVGDCAGYWQLAHTAFREGEVAAENACGHDAVVDNRAVPRPIYTDPEIAGVGLTEAQARERHGDDVAVGMFPWVANARAVMQAETVGWVKSIHETKYGELLGIVMVGPHVTDLIEAGTVAIDAEATVETVADGMAAHPTLSEAVKEAGLVALGCGIHRGTEMSTALLTRTSRHDRAFERLYKRHVHEVYRYVLAVLRNPADAEDATQATFLNAYRAFTRGEEPLKPRNWLLKIAHNECRQRFRASARRPKEVQWDERAAAPGADETVPTADEIKTALAHLSFNQRSALVMRELEGRSYAEIAGILNLSLSAVETLLFRARRALREQLEGTLTCGEAEATLSKRLDGRLNLSEQRSLRAHLRECPECALLERRQRARRRAIKGLGVEQLPPSLATFFGGSSAVTGGAIAGSGLVAKAAAVVAAAVVAGGVGHQAVQDVLAAEPVRTPLPKLRQLTRQFASSAAPWSIAAPGDPANGSQIGVGPGSAPGSGDVGQPAPGQPGTGAGPGSSGSEQFHGSPAHGAPGPAQPGQSPATPSPVQQVVDTAKGVVDKVVPEPGGTTPPPPALPNVPLPTVPPPSQLLPPPPPAAAPPAPPAAARAVGSAVRAGRARVA